MAKPKKYVHYTVRRARRRRQVRMLLYAVCLTLAIFIAKGIVTKAVHPWWMDHSERKEAADIQRQIAQAKAENMGLRQDIAFLDTVEGKEAEARKLGWVKQGEVAVVVAQPGPSPFGSEPLPQPSVWDRLSIRMAGVFVKGK